MISETQSKLKQHKSDLRRLSLVFFIIMDLFYAGILLSSIGKVCDTPLKSWLFGAIVLSYPATKFINAIECWFGQSIAIISEVILFIGSFLWFTLGTVWVNTSLVCQSTAPALWWTSFVTISSIWFFTAGLALSLIGITVYHMISTGGSNPEFNAGSTKQNMAYT
ncbi:hypothetical protein FG386_000753 [Cryptosporidium ryanae]|uniref:uncharacterized protein n=1 Tax=Cryptosporidium ryanae TaxID=515981 RepID=UPI00351A30A1|nr:hypothetical protein FG386_000753 [Cryptosporidium ryanae]